MPLFAQVEGTASVSVYSISLRLCKYVGKDGHNILCGNHELTISDAVSSLLRLKFVLVPLPDQLMPSGYV